jgi:hypothetical protein
MRTGRTGTPCTSSGSRPASRCRRPWPGPRDAILTSAGVHHAARPNLAPSWQVR